MEVKDLFENENELSSEEKKQVYKDIQKYINSKDYEKLVKYCTKQWDELLEEIREEVVNREKTELIKSKLDHLVEYTIFLEDILNVIDNSAGGNIIKKHIDTDIELANNNIEIRVEDFWDAPIYSKVDMLKMMRADYMTIDKKINEYSNVYTEAKEEEVKAMHPY